MLAIDHLASRLLLDDNTPWRKQLYIPVTKVVIQVYLGVVSAIKSILLW